MGRVRQRRRSTAPPAGASAAARRDARSFLHVTRVAIACSSQTRGSDEPFNDFGKAISVGEIGVRTATRSLIMCVFVFVFLGGILALGGSLALSVSAQSSVRAGGPKNHDFSN